MSRQFLGHWRTFQVHMFNPQRELVMIAKHPFRILFQRLDILDPSGITVGTVQQRFSIFFKKFDVLDAQGSVVMEVKSPLWRLWTFPFTIHGRQVACVQKKWTGFLHEVFTDKDNFMLEFNDPSLSETNRHLLLASAMFIDLNYFERKAS